MTLVSMIYVVRITLKKIVEHWSLKTIYTQNALVMDKNFYSLMGKRWMENPVGDYLNIESAMMESAFT